MNKKYILVLAIILSTVIISGCKKEASQDTMARPSITHDGKENLSISRKFVCPYTGEEAPEDITERLPFMAIIENSRDARPQSGLNDADIVYETMAEGGIPRFIALYQKNNSPKIGPIRSARAYFLDISKEYSLPFAHCGYSDEAKAMIQNEHLMTLNEFTNGTYYWRDRERKAPHNLYTSSDKIRTLLTLKGYIKPFNLKLNFNKDYWNNKNLAPASTVNLKLNRFYNTNYTYKDSKYYKAMDGTNSVNKEDRTPIAVTNIVIQATSITLQKDNLHLSIDLLGEGTGWVISNGHAVKMKWFKKDSKSQTVLTDENGKDLPLNPGNTWWHIIDKSDVIEIK